MRELEFNRQTVSENKPGIPESECRASRLTDLSLNKAN